ncbi:hypothetical protein Ga0466249_001697 [Sporomusaceae bacterium BoRhaA]|uniref:hypothetical protein n=1 Tax=Pelorhabdus rhamnosifermentans TaxID=2772457 RepID=UPI001C063C6D|nr:hypothetical protein [Pelorhabdus rhamnosifermentans]MBU2700605.1 hypothetical protein [Pelorhabdus rhamnosifermentans]
MSKKASQFIIPAHPGPHQIEEMLAVCSNQIATLADILTGYKSDVAIKDTAYKRALAKAIIKGCIDRVPATIVAKVAEDDPDVIAARDALDISNAIYIAANGEYEGWNSHFVALRKMAEIRKFEMFSGTGPR